MKDDAQLLAGIPEFLSIGSMLKATPHMDGGQRIVYFEASNEGLDQQNEVIAAKARCAVPQFWRCLRRRAAPLNVNLLHPPVIKQPAD